MGSKHLVSDSGDLLLEADKGRRAPTATCCPELSTFERSAWSEHVGPKEKVAISARLVCRNTAIAVLCNNRHFSAL